MASLILGAAPGLIGAGVSLFQGSKAKEEQQELLNEIQNYNRQELVNPYSGLSVSTLGADRSREDLARTMSTYGRYAAMGGTRGISAFAPTAIAQQMENEAKIMANLDEQQKQIDIYKAQGKDRVQTMMERREEQDLAGLGNAYDLAGQRRAQANNQLVSSLFAAGKGAIESYNKQK